MILYQTINHHLLLVKVTSDILLTGPAAHEWGYLLSSSLLLIKSILQVEVVMFSLFPVFSPTLLLEVRGPQGEESPSLHYGPLRPPNHPWELYPQGDAASFYLPWPQLSAPVVALVSCGKFPETCAISQIVRRHLVSMGKKHKSVCYASATKKTS